MKKQLFFLFTFAFQLVQAQGSFTSSNLPIIKINTNGKTIGDDLKIIADMSIIDGKKGINTPNDSVIYKGKIGIELRGSTSLFLSDRKPYSIETRQDDGIANKDVALLGLPKENDWAFLAPFADKSLIREAFMYNLANEIMPWAPHFRFADVMVNGKYEGIYMVTEKIKRGKNRVNIDKIEITDNDGDELTGGYIFAFDKLKSKDVFFYSKYPYPNQSAYPEYVIVSPKADNITIAQKNYLRKWTHDFEDAMKSSTYNDPNTGYSKWIDVPSFIDLVLLNELSRNIDGYRLSTYFHKDKNSIDGRLHAGPAWDYNITLGNANYCNAQSTTGWAFDFNTVCGEDKWTIHFWWQKLIEDHQFRVLMKKRWQTLRKKDWTNTQLEKKLDTLKNTIGDAHYEHFKRFDILKKYVWPNPVIYNGYPDEVWALKQWVKKRADWMDTALNDITETTPKLAIGEDFMVFPNPVAEVLNFEFKPDYDNARCNVELYNIHGQLVLTETKNFTNRWHHVFQINLNNLPKGIYFYHFKGLAEIKLGKILKN
jgi:hypothetical protein